MPRIDEQGEAVQSQQDLEYQEHAERAYAGQEPAPDSGVESLGHVLVQEFSRAQADRVLIEQRWLKDLRQYKGRYEAEEEQAMGDRSKTFIRKTRVKVKTADSRMLDLLFPNGTERNWTIKPTPRPTLPDDVLATLQAQAESIAPQQGIAPQQAMEQLKSDYVSKAAREMTQTIADQLSEAKYKAVCSKVLHSGNLYGTGVMKGPLLERRVRSSYAPVKNGDRVKWQLKSVQYVVPTVSHVSLFNFYPDMSAVELQGCRFVYELHTMTQADLTELRKRPSFKGALIDAHIRSNPKGRVIQRSLEQEKRSVGDLIFDSRDTYQWDVLERWGWLSGEQLRDAGVNVPEDRLTEVFFSNIWMLPDGQVIKAKLSKLTGEADWPYRMYYFEKDEDSIFGNGLAEIMRDDQTNINAGVRMMLDNGAFAAGPQFIVDMARMSNATDASQIHPWKVWTTKVTPGSANLGDPIKMLQPQANLQGLSQLVNMFDTNADEVTALPRYMSGENVTRGAGGTASGMSMLMAAANVVLKDLLCSWDDGISQPMVEGFYNWNMRYNPDAALKGDFNVEARGASSLIAKEVRGMQLEKFLQQTDNPNDGAYVNRRKALREWANCIEMNDVMYSDEEVERNGNSPEAKQLRELQQSQQQMAMQLQQAQTQKVLADAKRAQAAAEKMTADIELVVEKAVETRVNAIYIASQAGQTLLQNPGSAMAADQLFRSAGGRDQQELRNQNTQDEGMELLSQALQSDSVTAQGTLDGTNHPDKGGPALPQPASPLPVSAGGADGARAGVETARDDGAPQA